VGEGVRGPPGLFAAFIEEVDIGATGVLAVSRSLGLAMADQDQPVIDDAHVHRLCPNLEH
jgi:hypothetical protein